MATQIDQARMVTVGKTNLTAEPGKQEIVITRLFDAARERLFRALTDPALVQQWCGSPGQVNTLVDQMDVRPGGSWRWRFVNPRDASGGIGLHGIYHTVVPPERLVYTFEFEGVPGHVLLRTITLRNQNGRTLLTEQSVFQSMEDRDGMLQSGIKEGTVGSWDRLEALLRKR
ncbi:MAG TPA: SRPBCC family protein [Anaerolineales bacterium]|nr:SRPBCC family protein [Anaerolineales bacterium]